MKTGQIAILIVSFFLGMLLLNMVKNVCGCELKEGFTWSGDAAVSVLSKIDGRCGGPTSLNLQTIVDNCARGEENEDGDAENPPYTYDLVSALLDAESDSGCNEFVGYLKKCNEDGFRSRCGGTPSERLKSLGHGSCDSTPTPTPTPTTTTDTGDATHCPQVDLLGKYECTLSDIPIEAEHHAVGTTCGIWCNENDGTLTPNQTVECKENGNWMEGDSLFNDASFVAACGMTNDCGNLRAHDGYTIDCSPERMTQTSTLHNTVCPMYCPGLGESVGTATCTNGDWNLGNPEQCPQSCVSGITEVSDIPLQLISPDERTRLDINENLCMNACVIPAGINTCCNSTEMIEKLGSLTNTSCDEVSPDNAVELQEWCNSVAYTYGQQNITGRLMCPCTCSNVDGGSGTVSNVDGGSGTVSESTCNDESSSILRDGNVQWCWGSNGVACNEDSGHPAGSLCCSSATAIRKINSSVVRRPTSCSDEAVNTEWCAASQEGSQTGALGYTGRDLCPCACSNLEAVPLPPPCVDIADGLAGGWSEDNMSCATHSGETHCDDEVSDEYFSDSQYDGRRLKQLCPVTCNNCPATGGTWTSTTR